MDHGRCNVSGLCRQHAAVFQYRINLQTAEQLCANVADFLVWEESQGEKHEFVASEVDCQLHSHGLSLPLAEVVEDNELA